jgi:hypothetical protein
MDRARLHQASGIADVKKPQSDFREPKKQNRQEKG